MVIQAVSQAFKRIERSQKFIGLGILGLIGILFGGYFLYQGYVAKREQQAQIRFVDSIEILMQANTAGFDPKRKKYQQGLYEEAELAFQAAYDQNKSAYLAPYFVAMQATALIKQGKRAEAIAQYKKAIDLLSQKATMKNLFKIQIALLKIDDEALHENGIKELTQLAQNSDNMYQDLAQYYLGNYYWSNDQLDQAKSVWLQLMESQKESDLFVSPWAELAGMKLASIF